MNEYVSAVPLLRDIDFEHMVSLDPSYEDVLKSFPHIRGTCARCKSDGMAKESVAMDVMARGDKVIYLCSDCYRQMDNATSERQVYDKALMDTVWQALELYPSKSEEERRAVVSASISLFLGKWKGFADDVPDDHPFIVAIMERFASFLDETAGQGGDRELGRAVMDLEYGHLTPKEQFVKLHGDQIKGEGKA